MTNDQQAVYDVLQKAHDYVARGWTQGPFAVDKNNQPVTAVSPDACKWCASGALHRAFYDITPFHDYFVDEKQRIIAANAMRRALLDTGNDRVAKDFRNDCYPMGVLIGFNEMRDTTQQQVIQVFKKAMDMVKESA